MKPRSRVKFKGRRESGTFLKIPTDVLECPKLCRLSHKAKALLLDLGSQHRGYNNGDMSATWSRMRTRGWRSKETLASALRELIAAGMIERTRQGGLHACSLYGFTWLPIDSCRGKLDVAETSRASGLWRSDPPSSEAPPKHEAHPDQRGTVTRPAGHKPSQRPFGAPTAVPKAA